VPGDPVMRVGIGDSYARCPYCGSVEFAADDFDAAPPRELLCAQCGGYASRKLLLDQITRKPAERGGNEKR
jgi:hypothetical protein